MDTFLLIFLLICIIVLACERSNSNSSSSSSSSSSIKVEESYDDFKKRGMLKPFTDIGMTEQQIKKVVSVYYLSYRESLLARRNAEFIAREFKKAQEKGWTIDELLNEWSCRSWRGFKADWLDVKTVSPDEALRRLQEESGKLTK